MCFLQQQNVVMEPRQSDAASLTQPSIHVRTLDVGGEAFPDYLINPKEKLRTVLVSELYFSLHFVKMFEYIKSYLKMSN